MENNKIILGFVLVVVLVLVVGVVVIARPAKNLYDGKTVGNTGITNIVGDNSGGGVSGWVRYSKDANALQSTWVVNGLEPDTEYQLKLHTKTGDDRVDQACEFPETGAIWQCGDWGSDEGFLVMATVTSNAQGKINHVVKEDRLVTGDYSEMQFMVTQNVDPWLSAWTWENPAETISAFSIK